jgi:hypothetical protein
MRVLPKFLAIFAKWCAEKGNFTGLYRKPRRKKTQDSPMRRVFPGFFRKTLKRVLVPTAGFELAT